MDPQVTPDGLLELGHGAHFAVERDLAAGLGIRPDGEQARGGDDHRVFGFRINEVAELGRAFGVAAGDAHDVTAVLLGEAFVLVDECSAHPLQENRHGCPSCVSRCRPAYRSEVGARHYSWAVVTRRAA